MTRAVAIALAGAPLLFGAGLALLVRASREDGAADPGGAGTAVAARRGESAGLEADPVRRAPDGGDSPASAAPRERAPAAGPGGGARDGLARAAGGAGGGGAARGRDEGPASGESGEREPASGPAQLLEGEALTEALAGAFEEGELGALQGLLISSLTLKGTKLAAEDLPLLQEALLHVEDHGLQKLLLAHLERLEAPAEAKTSAYLEYLASSPRPDHAEDAFRQLVRLKDPGAVGGLADLLRDPGRPKLHAGAAQALGEIGDPRGVPVLRESLARLEDPRAAAPCARALARIGGPEAIGALLDFAAREPTGPALGALREIRDPDAAPLISESLLRSAPEAYVRAALGELRRLGDPRSLRDLGRFLERAAPPLAREAIGTLSSIRDPDAAGILEAFSQRQSDPRLAAEALRAARNLRARLEREGGAGRRST
ncbi:MAG: HEAT repeat domain-containing protein [Planctomycetes bacterium]|nr:HEAT repeat domain-containing protein [Planctomycetota bacterium]